MTRALSLAALLTFVIPAVLSAKPRPKPGFRGEIKFVFTNLYVADSGMESVRIVITSAPAWFIVGSDSQMGPVNIGYWKDQEFRITYTLGPGFASAVGNQEVRYTMGEAIPSTSTRMVAFPQMGGHGIPIYGSQRILFGKKGNGMFYFIRDKGDTRPTKGLSGPKLLLREVEIKCKLLSPDGFHDLTPFFGQT